MISCYFACKIHAYLQVLKMKNQNDKIMSFLRDGVYLAYNNGNPQPTTLGEALRIHDQECPLCSKHSEIRELST